MNQILFKKKRTDCPANAKDMSSIPGPGRFYMLQGN